MHPAILYPRRSQCRPQSWYSRATPLYAIGGPGRHVQNPVTHSQGPGLFTRRSAGTISAGSSLRSMGLFAGIEAIERGR
jgi:hypothetical protein